MPDQPWTPAPRKASHLPAAHLLPRVAQLLVQSAPFSSQRGNKDAWPPLQVEPRRGDRGVCVLTVAEPGRGGASAGKQLFLEWKIFRSMAHSRAHACRCGTRPQGAAAFAGIACMGWAVRGAFIAPPSWLLLSGTCNLAGNPPPARRRRTCRRTRRPAWRACRRPRARWRCLACLVTGVGPLAGRECRTWGCMSRVAQRRALVQRPIWVAVSHA